MQKLVWEGTRYLGGIPMFPKKGRYTLKLERDCFGLFKGKKLKFEGLISSVSDVSVMSYLDLVRPTESADRSVIGRGVVGGLLLGPVGAVVGGMSGVGRKQKLTFEQETLKKEHVVVLSASDAGIEFQFGLIASALFARRNAADNLMAAIQQIRVLNAREEQAQALGD